jgi:hypothetical protein
MTLKTYSELETADMLVSYLLDDETGPMGLAFVPLSMRAQVVPPREDLRGVREIETGWGVLQVRAEVENRGDAPVDLCLERSWVGHAVNWSASHDRASRWKGDSTGDGAG